MKSPGIGESCQPASAMTKGVFEQSRKEPLPLQYSGGDTLVRPVCSHLCLYWLRLNSHAQACSAGGKLGMANGWEMRCHSGLEAYLADGHIVPSATNATAPAA